MVFVAQFGRALACDAGGCGFEPRRTHQHGLVVQLVARQVLSLHVLGSSPSETSKSMKISLPEGFVAQRKRSRLIRDWSVVRIHPDPPTVQNRLELC